MRYWWYRLVFWFRRGSMYNVPLPVSTQQNELNRLVAEVTEKRIQLAELNERMRIFRKNKNYLDSLPSKGDPNYPKDPASIDQMIAHLQYCKRCLDDNVEIVPLAMPTQSIEITEMGGPVQYLVDNRPIPSYVPTGG